MSVQFLGAGNRNVASSDIKGKGVTQLVGVSDSYSEAYIPWPDGATAVFVTLYFNPDNFYVQNPVWWVTKIGSNMYYRIGDYTLNGVDLGYVFV